jgi:DNA-binding transcriptional ArsR family regulator
MSEPVDIDSNKTENVEIMSTEDEKIKLIGSLLGNDSSRMILKLLLEKEMTANEIALETGMRVSLVIHHLQKMQESGMVKISKIGKSSKGHDMKFYSPTKLVVIIFPSKLSNKAKNSKSLLNSLNRIYRFASIGLAGIVSWVLVQNMNNEPTHGGVVSGQPMSDLLTVVVPLSVMFFGLIIERILTAFRR